MKATSFGTTGATRAAAGALAVAVWVLFGAAAPAFAQGARALEGVWALTLTPLNCATGAPLAAPADRSLLTVHQGGTMSASAGGRAFAPGQRSDAHGAWTYAGGTTFRNRQVAIVLFDTPPTPPTSPGFLTGWQLISSTYTMSDDNNLTVAATTDFYDVNRTVYRSACVAGIGERFR
jgi:hypothetical protein